MLAAVCTECGSDVPFIIEEEQKPPIVEQCSDCGAVYRLNVRKERDATR